MTALRGINNQMNEQVFLIFIFLLPPASQIYLHCIAAIVYLIVCVIILFLDGDFFFFIRSSEEGGMTQWPALISRDLLPHVCLRLPKDRKIFH